MAAETQAETEAEFEAARRAAQAQTEVEAAEKTDDEILAELGLRAPEDLGEGEDFKAFLREAVPARIQRRALRALWRSNPVLANVDMLVDYGGDFTDKAMIVEGLQTAYQVGKGMLKHVEAVAAKAEAEAEAEALTMEDAAPSEDDVEGVEAPSDVVAPEPEVMVAAAPDVPIVEAGCDQSLIGPDAEPGDFVARKRMRFDFPQTGEASGPQFEKGDA